MQNCLMQIVYAHFFGLKPVYEKENCPRLFGSEIDWLFLLNQICKIEIQSRTFTPGPLVSGTQFDERRVSAAYFLNHELKKSAAHFFWRAHKERSKVFLRAQKGVDRRRKSAERAQETNTYMKRNDAYTPLLFLALTKMMSALKVCSLGCVLKIKNGRSPNTTVSYTHLTLPTILLV